MFPVGCSDSWACTSFRLVTSKQHHHGIGRVNSSICGTSNPELRADVTRGDHTSSPNLAFCPPSFPRLRLASCWRARKVEQAMQSRNRSSVTGRHIRHALCSSLSRSNPSRRTMKGAPSFQPRTRSVPQGVEQVLGSVLESAPVACVPSPSDGSRDKSVSVGFGRPQPIVSTLFRPLVFFSTWMSRDRVVFMLTMMQLKQLHHETKGPCESTTDDGFRRKYIHTIMMMIVKKTWKMEDGREDPCGHVTLYFT